MHGQERALHLILLALLLACSACAADDVTRLRDPLSAADLTEPLPPLPNLYTRRGQCTPLTSYVPPTAGSSYVYRRQDGGRSSRVIQAVSGDLITFQYRNLSTESAEPLPPRKAVAGLFVGGPASGAGRSIRYAEAPTTFLARLQPGQTATLATTETTEFAGKSLTLSLPTLVKYESCGTISLMGEAVPVRVYRISSARRTFHRVRGESIRRTATAFYLSEETGYPLIFQDDTLTVIEQILPPAQSRSNP